MDTGPFIPAWVVSGGAFLAAASLWLVRPMPRLIRISIMISFLHFGGLYFYATTLPFGIITATDLVRLGLLFMFLPIIVNSIIVRLQWIRQGYVK